MATAAIGEEVTKFQELRMDAGEYHKLATHHSASSLKMFLSSRRDYHSRYILGEEQPAKPNLDLGKVAHALILEPHLLDDVVVQIPKEALASNGAKSGSNWKKFKADHCESILLKSEEMQHVKAMFAACYANPMAKKLLTAKGQTEHTIIHNGERNFRVRPDRITSGFVIDLKTSADASPRGFWRSVQQFRYYLQASLYLRVCNECRGEEHTFVFVVVRSSPPYHVACYTLDQQWLTRGEAEIEQAVEDIELCHQHDDWREPWEKELLQLSTPKYWREDDEYTDN